MLGGPVSGRRQALATTEVGRLRRAGHVQRRCLTHRAMSGSADEPLTWPPRGRWSRTASGIAGRKASGLGNSLRNQTLISPGECNRPRVPDALFRFTPPSARSSGDLRCPYRAHHGRPRRAAAGQFPAEPAQGRPAQPGLQAGPQRPGPHQRRTREGRPPAGGGRRGPHPAGADRGPGRQGHAGQGAARGHGGEHRLRGSASAGDQQAVGRRQPWRQRHQLSASSKPCARCARPRRSNWCIGSIATLPAC